MSIDIGDWLRFGRGRGGFEAAWQDDDGRVVYENLCSGRYTCLARYNVEVSSRYDRQFIDTYQNIDNSPSWC